MQAFESNLKPFSLNTALSLTGKQYHAVRVDAASLITLNTSGATISAGVLQTVADAVDKAVSLSAVGNTKAVAGAAIVAGVGVEVNSSGRFITLASGIRIGTALTAASADGAIFTLSLDK